jgi:hypothetical protein
MCATEPTSFKQAVSLSLLTINNRLKDMQKIISNSEKSVVDRFRDLHSEIVDLENLYDIEIKNLAHFAASVGQK